MEACSFAYQECFSTFSKPVYLSFQSLRQGKTFVSASLAVESVNL